MCPLRISVFEIDEEECTARKFGAFHVITGDKPTNLGELTLTGYPDRSGGRVGVGRNTTQLTRLPVGDEDSIPKVNVSGEFNFGSGDESVFFLPDDNIYVEVCGVKEL